jgi:hypothetical protein
VTLALFLILFLLESFTALFEIPRLLSLVQEQLWWVSRVEKLRLCPPVVALYKSQHFIFLIGLIPVKAMLLAILFDVRVRFSDSNFAKRIWTAILYVLSCLLGLVFVSVVFVMYDPLARSLKISPQLQLEAFCSEVTFTYSAVMSIMNLVASAGLWPIASGVLTLMSRKQRADGEQ